MAILTNILTGGSSNHQTTSENANQIATDFVAEGVVGAVTNTSGVAPATGALSVNAQGSPNMTVAVGTGVAYVTATPSGQASQTLRVYNNASSNVTIAANLSGSTKYDWVYLSVSAANAANPNTAGDNVATLVTSRSSSASSDDGTPPTYGYALAVVTVANAASSITNGNIADVRNMTSASTSLAWQSWSVVLTNWTIGTGGSAGTVAKYTVVGKTLFFYIRSVLGTSGQSVGSNAEFTLPVAPATASSNAPLGQLFGISAGLGYPGQITNQSGKGRLVFLLDDTGAASQYVGQTFSASGVPNTWTAGDSFVAQGFYEVA